MTAFQPPGPAFERYLATLPAQAVEGRQLWCSAATGQVQGQFFQCSLTSVFAPIVSLATGEVVAHEGRIRTYADGGAGLSAWKLFSMAADDESLIALDRLCRLVHAVNYAQQVEPVRLVLNIHGRLLAAVADDHGAAFRRVLDALELPICNVIIQVPAAANDDLQLLLQVVTNYRRNGFAIALQAEDLAQAGVLLAHGKPHWLGLDMRRRWAPNQLDALRITADEQGATLIGRQIGGGNHVRLLQRCGIAIGQFAGAADAQDLVYEAGATSANTAETEHGATR
jgi:hypothetical protein